MAIKEVAIAARDFGPGRAQEGDIVVVREPVGEIGRAERKDFLWFTIDDLLLPDAQSLQQVDTDESGNQVNKRRYRIALDDLRTLEPSVDLSRVRDTDDDYQPLVDPDPTTGRFRSLPIARPGRDLVRDKVAERPGRGGMQRSR